MATYIVLINYTDKGLLTRWQANSDRDEYLCRVRLHDWS